MTIYYFANKKRSMAITIIAEDEQAAQQYFERIVNDNYRYDFPIVHTEDFPENTIRVGQWYCTLSFAKYPNGTIAIEAIDARSGEGVQMCTLNAEDLWMDEYNSYEEFMKFPVVVIDERDEWRKGIIEDLVSQGVITTGAYIAGTNGEVHVCRLTEKWQEIALKELQKIYPNDYRGSKTKRGKAV